MSNNSYINIEIPDVAGVVNVTADCSMREAQRMLTTALVELATDEGLDSEDARMFLAEIMTVTITEMTVRMGGSWIDVYHDAVDKRTESIPYITYADEGGRKRVIN